jgi:hypothetical protein
MTNVRLKLMEAIARKLTVSTRYNGEALKLAPHLLFERHGDLFVGALNMSRNWRAGDERKLGHFKLNGLGMTELMDETFIPLPSSLTVAPRSEDVVIFAI